MVERKTVRTTHGQKPTHHKCIAASGADAVQL